LIQCPGFNTVQIRQIRIQHHSLTAQQQNPACQRLWNEDAHDEINSLVR
jgi:hypothetical protein